MKSSESIFLMEMVILVQNYPEAWMARYPLHFPVLAVCFFYDGPKIVKLSRLSLA
jgi:hypothetical protein